MKTKELKAAPVHAQAAASGQTAPAAQEEESPVTGKSYPTVISFALIKRDNLFHAVALKTKGREIIDEKILETDDHRNVALSAIDAACHEFWINQVDPFQEKKRD